MSVVELPHLLTRLWLTAWTNCGWRLLSQPLVAYDIPQVWVLCATRSATLTDCSAYSVSPDRPCLVIVRSTVSCAIPPKPCLCTDTTKKVNTFGEWCTLVYTVHFCCLRTASLSSRDCTSVLFEPLLYPLVIALLLSLTCFSIIL